MRRIRTLLGILGIAATFTSAKTLLILPISGDSSKSEDIQTINGMYHGFIEPQYTGQIINSPDSFPACGQRDCALKAAQTVHADQVIYSALYRLGSKWIFNSTIINADGSGGFNQNLSALSIEDMESVTHRIADALIQRKDIEQVATVDNITENEENLEPGRRRTSQSTGISLGYAFPVGKSFSYLQTTGGQEYNDSLGEFVNVPDSTHRYKPYSQIISLSLTHNWQFENNLLINSDVTWGVPDAFIGADLNLDYLFSRGDYAPFLGGGLGLYYVFLQDNPSGNKNYSGIAVNLDGGILLFRTYNANVMLRGQYRVILNSDLDNSVGIDLGVTYRKSEEDKSTGSSSGGTGFFTVVGYIVVGLIAIGIIESVAAKD